MTFVPFYRRIIADIRAKIASGELRPGDKLPPVRMLARQHGCGAESTARLAVTLLRESGELRGHQGIGVFVAEPRSPGRAGQRHAT